jgi:hypothetical protein
MFLVFWQAGFCYNSSERLKFFAKIFLHKIEENFITSLQRLYDYMYGEA